MVIVRLCGGLGNQMFQYAAARRVALVSGQTLKLDVGWFSNIPDGDTPRKYELGVFNCIQDTATFAEVHALRGIDISLWPKLVKRFLKHTGLIIKKSYVREGDFSFQADLTRSGDLYLDGFWQSPKYFSDVEEVIRKDFEIKVAQDDLNRNIAEVMRSCESVSLHVRRGDYVTDHETNKYHGVSSMEYYAAAVAEMKKRVTSPHFFIFSDEPDWVRDNLRLDVPTTYLAHNLDEKAYEDLRLMSLCRHHITANSSFSWWGAWLSRNAGQVVIAPKKWFSQPSISTGDLIPEQWLRL